MRQELHDYLDPYQRDGVAAALANPRFLILDPAGLGKTVQMVGLVDTLFQRGELGRVLVGVQGTTLGRQLAGVLQRWLPEVPVLFGESTAAGRRALDAFAESEGPGIVVTTYDLIHTRQADPWMQSNWVLFVMDEVSALKGKKTRQETCRAISRRCGRVLGMTATELENAGTDTWAILDVVGTPDLWPEDYFGDTFIDWKDAYTNPHNGKEVKAKPRGLKMENLPEFRAYVNRYSVRRTAEEAGVVLPVPIGDRVVWVQPTPAQAGKLRWIDSKRATDWRWLKREEFSAFAEPYGGGLATSAKALAATEWLLRRPDQRKVLIFAERLDHLDIQARLLEANGITYVRIEGKSNTLERSEAVDEFNNDPSVRVFLGSRVLERGLDGLKGASALLTLGCTNNPAREEQREGRIQRRGSPHATYEHLTFMLDHEHDRGRWADVASKRDQQQALRATG